MKTILKLKTEDSYTFEVGENGVVNITEHRAQGEGDKWYYDVECDTFNVRVFNPTLVTYSK